jgi:hypothetical protein
VFLGNLPCQHCVNTSLSKNTNNSSLYKDFVQRTRQVIQTSPPIMFPSSILHRVTEMCQITVEYFECCPEKMYDARLHKCPNFQPPGPYEACKVEQIDKIIDGLVCWPCREDNKRREERNRTVKKWLDGVQTYGKDY